MMRRSLWMKAPLLVFALALSSQAVPQTSFLKEILLGRCYFRPPSNGDKTCPSLVDTIMSVFEGRNDRDIRLTDFGPYLDKVDWSVPDDRGLIWIGNHARSVASLVRPEDTPGGALMDGLVFCGNNPPGHDCLEGHHRHLDTEQEQQAAQQQQQQAQQEQEQQAQQALQLQQQQAQQEEAARDHEQEEQHEANGEKDREQGKREREPKQEKEGDEERPDHEQDHDTNEIEPKHEQENHEKNQDEQPEEEHSIWTGAKASFWAGSYQRFALNLAGRLRIVVENEAMSDDELLYIKAALPKMDPNRISRVDIHLMGADNQCDKSEMVTKVRGALDERGIGPVTCMEDRFLLKLESCTKEDSEVCRFVSECTSQSAQSAASTSDSSTEQVQPKQRRHKHGPLVPLAVVLIVGIAVVLVVKALDIGLDYDAVPQVKAAPEERLPLTQ